jgi:diketogulonate reductase-like aldo/keto reductase
MYLLHRYSREIPLKETVGALNKLVQNGYIKHIGVCNFGVKHLQEAQAYAETPIVCNQVHYNLIFREPERAGLLEYCQKNDVFLSAWRPVQKGQLTTQANSIIASMCSKYNATPTQIAIAWLTTQPNVITLSKTRDLQHLYENISGLNILMDKEDVEFLRLHYPEQKDFSDAVQLS